MVVEPDNNTQSKDPHYWEPAIRKRSQSNFSSIPASRIDKADGVAFRPRPDLAQNGWADVLCRRLVIPYSGDKRGIVLASTTYAEALRAADELGIADRLTGVKLASASQIIPALTRRYGEALTQQAISGLRDAAPEYSAATAFPRWMRALWIAVTALIVMALIAIPAASALNMWVLFIPYFTATMALRALLLFNAARPAPAQTTIRKTTPIVSILVPVYREAESLPALVKALKALDYPIRALDIKILLEEDDTGTIAEAFWLTAGTHIECLIVPPSEPRTKPKAMNFALPFVRGSIVGIFDAEDAPEADQISKAVMTLEAGGEDVVCAQARLSHYNPTDNLMTRCVAIEYALWFDMLLAGLSRTDLPVPLGGTSLYFRTATLRDIGGWDPHNVTEDADLGLRLARAGKQARVFDSTTFEEATGSMAAWIKQRSRWIKGFMLTWAVHMRDPARAARELGLLPMVAINIMLLDGFLSFLLQPVILLSGILALTMDMPPWLGVFDVRGVALLMIVLFGGQIMLLIGAAIASHRRFGWQVAFAVPLMLPYWMMGGVAALKALGQIATKPQFWEKTVHCVSPVAQARRMAVLTCPKND